MSPKTRRRAAVAGALLALVAVGVPAVLWVTRPAPAPPAPPPPPPRWECGTSYGKEICERQLPPVRPAP